jgi:hypothetical protein
MITYLSTNKTYKRTELVSIEVIIGLLVGLNSKDFTKIVWPPIRNRGVSKYTNILGKDFVKDSALCGNMMYTLYLDFIG